MFPIYILKKGTTLPKEGNFYIIARDGVYLHKDTGLIKATVKVEGISFLDSVTSSAQLMLPKLSQDLIVRTLLFFRAVYKKHRGEAEVQLHYNSPTGEYLLHCPEQKISGTGVSYDSKDRFDGFHLVGTIHSHCGSQAFHSGIDHNDELHFDGLHITIGHVNQPYFTISCSMMVNGKRFTFQPEDVIIGIKKVDWHKTTIINHRRPVVSHQPSQEAGLIDKLFYLTFPDLSYFGTGYQPTHYTGTTTHISGDQFWDIAMPEGQDYRHVGFPRHWLEKVSPYVYPTVASIISRGLSTVTSNYLAEKPDTKQFEDLEPDKEQTSLWGPSVDGLGILEENIYEG